MLIPLGVFLELVGVSLIMWRLRGRWLGHTGAVFAVVLFFYHGVTEVVQVAFPNQNPYRLITNAGALGTTLVMAGAALIIFAVMYLLALGRGDPEPLSVSALEPLWHARVPLFAMAIATAYFRVTGQVSGDLAGASTASGYWLTGLVLEYGDFSMALAILALIYRWPREGTLVVLTGVLALTTALSGASRLLMLIAVLMTLGSAARYGRVIRLSRLVVLGVFGLALMLAISAARQAVGREMLKEGGSKDRLQGFASGISSIQGNSDAQAGVLYDFVYRFDGNSFSAIVRDSFDKGMVPMGPYPLAADAALVVPSFLYPAKLSIDPMLMNEKFLAVLYFALPYGDYNVMGMGHLYAMFGTAGFLLAAALGGALFGRLDRWLRTRPTLGGAIVAIGLLRCATYYEWGLSIYLTTARSLLTMYILLMGWLALRAMLHRFRMVTPERLSA